MELLVNSESGKFLSEPLINESEAIETGESGANLTSSSSGTA
jgi:hypothetical protein